MGKINSSNAWVFIFHSNKDFDKIIHVRNKLEALHYKPLLFFLKCLDDDKEIFELIKREIQARDRFILCDSKNSREYEWVQKEKDFIISLNRPYEIINLDGTDVEIDESIKRFNQRSTIYIWSTDDKINEFVAKNFIDKAYRVELLYNNYLKEYYLYKTGSPDLVLLGECLVNETHGIIFLLVDNLGIHLRDLHLGMSHQLACGIDVRTQREHHSAKGMSAAVKGDGLGYTSLVKPRLKVELGVDLNRYVFKDQFIVCLVTSLRHPLHGFL